MSITRSPCRKAPATRAALRPEAAPAATKRWLDAGLLLVAHGAPGRAEAVAATQRQAELLRPLFADVCVAFLAQRPRPDEMLPLLRGTRVFVVPLFMSEGYFTRVAVPSALGASAAGRPVVICAPLGTAEALRDVVLDRVLAVCREHDLTTRRAAVVLAAHGSRDDPASRRTAELHAARLGVLGRFASVRVAFLEEPPSLETQLSALDGDVVVAGLFALQGSHADRDIPAAIAAGGARRPGRTFYTGAIGADPAIAVAVLGLVRDAAA